MSDQHAACRETEQRLREANRRLQAEGPALERDKLIVSLRAHLRDAMTLAKAAHVQSDEGVIVTEARRVEVLGVTCAYERLRQAGLL